MGVLPGGPCHLGCRRGKPFYRACSAGRQRTCRQATPARSPMLRRHGKEVAIIYLQQPQARAAGAPALRLPHLGRGRRRDRGARERARRGSGLPRALRRAGRRPGGCTPGSVRSDRIALAAALVDRARDARRRTGQVVLRRAARMGLRDWRVAVVTDRRGRRSLSSRAKPVMLLQACLNGPRKPGEHRALPIQKARARR